MIDLTRLEEARLRLARMGPTDAETNAIVGLRDDLEMVAALVDAVLDGQDIWWCEEHRAEGDEGEAHWCRVAYVLWEQTGASTTWDCRMVKVRLVKLEDE